MKHVYANLATKGWVKLTSNDQINGYNPNAFIGKVKEGNLTNVQTANEFFYIDHEGQTFYVAKNMLQVVEDGEA